MSNPRLIAVTGGPCGGKTTFLELARQHLCSHLVYLPEAAGIIYSGGFTRRKTQLARMASQHAIFHVQRQLERIAAEEPGAIAILCDRGTLDGLSYWPGDDASFFQEMETTLDKELRRYTAVIHLRSPSEGNGYNRDNPNRIESAREAALADERILNAWGNHPRRIVIESQVDFSDKIQLALTALKAEIPACCGSSSA